ncbi:MAG: hypothetical protein ISS67_05505 [Desulfobacterales bacterium]|uniref:Uncharacterized protein n=1 Tax=Candidatus Desulfaltia bathyphila TaxID=2841697 RepID=A0A8J6T6Q2_9BACT|nr:hypothetical protein [Candidatus Desulfaltia bathyphila]MBL7196227.1 hypothetical protein [Desulfobacterales bacterium]MBL7207962.1 hypothetical protein [Desulfobacterales bacterium]
MIQSVIKIWIKNKILLSVLILCLFLLGLLWPLDPAHSLIKTISLLETQLLVKLLVSGFLLSIPLITAMIILYKSNNAKINIDDYDFNEETGLYTHKKTKIKYCTSCLLKNISSPVAVLSNGWRCQYKECNKFYTGLVLTADIPSGRRVIHKGIPIDS